MRVFDAKQTQEQIKESEFLESKERFYSKFLQE
jgi:hypothetical protein